MADLTNGGDDILLNINVTGRDQLTGARSDAKGLNDELNNGGKNDISKPVVSLRQQLRQAIIAAQELAASGRQNTKEFTDAAKHVAEIKLQIEELNNTFKAFDPANKFRVFGTVASAGAHIVQGYAGAMAFLGVKSEDATETIAKLQGILALTDAIDSLKTLKGSFTDVLRLLGLNTTASTTLAQAQTDGATASVAATVEQTAAQTDLNTAITATADTEATTDAAIIESKGEVTAATEASTEATTAEIEAINAKAVANEKLFTTQTQLNAATAQGTAAAETQAVAMDGTAVAEGAAEVGAIGLGTALKAIGIGLIIAAIAYLIDNFNNIKKTLIGLFPSLGQAGTLFNDFKKICYGVGNVILQYIIAPIKAIVDAVQGNFKKAIQDLKDGLDIVANYQAGAAHEAANIAAEELKKKEQLEIESNERIIKQRKALGQSTYELEQKNVQLKIALLDKDKLSDEEYQKQKLDLENEATVAYDEELKKRNDKYKAALKTDLDAIKANEKENAKIVAEGTASEQSILEREADFKYQTELALLNKRKDANKNYLKDLQDLNTAHEDEKAKIAQKYTDAVAAYDDDTNKSFLDKFDQEAIDIKKKADDLLKTLSDPNEIQQVKDDEQQQLDQNRQESIANKASQAANNNLSNVERSQESDDAEGGQTPEQAAQAVSDLEEARLDAEQKAYDLEKIQKAGQLDELAALETSHEKKVTDIAVQGAASRKKIAQDEAEAKLKLLDAVSSGLSAASDIAGQNTIAGKALAVAAATISTYTAIAGQLAAFSGVPIPGYAIAQAIATGLVGLEQVKKILTVQVPTTGGGGSSAGAGVAPVINTTVLNQANAGTPDVVNAVNNNNQANQAPLKAYITNKDLNQQAARNAYFNSQSEY